MSLDMSQYEIEPVGTFAHVLEVLSNGEKLFIRSFPSEAEALAWIKNRARPHDVIEDLLPPG